MDQDTELEAIKARGARVPENYLQMSSQEYQAHFDRATLLTLLEAERAARLKAEAELAEVRELVRDRNTLLINMMRGNIPKIHAGSLYKLYTEDELINASRDVFKHEK